MLLRLLKQLVRDRARGPAAPATRGAPLRLHIGGRVAHPDWKIVDVLPGAHTDYVSSCTDLSAFGDATITEIYASHVIEHLGYQRELPAALAEFRRVLVPGGTLRVSVPDLDTLCALFADPGLDVQARFHVMRMMFGGQTDEADFHRVGLNEPFLMWFLRRAGFTGIRRVAGFGLFDDSSALVFADRPISLNLIASAPAAGQAAPGAPEAHHSDQADLSTDSNLRV